MTCNFCGVADHLDKAIHSSDCPRRTKEEIEEILAVDAKEGEGWRSFAVGGRGLVWRPKQKSTRG